jgi:hypothetical protein
LLCIDQSQTLREEHRLRVLNKRVLRKIFGTTVEEVATDWKFVLFTKYYLGDQIKADEMGRT